MTFKTKWPEMHEQLTGWPYRPIQEPDPAPRNDGIEDPSSIGVSLREYNERLPKIRSSENADGLVLRLPRTGLVVVLTNHRSGPIGGGWWAGIVVAGSKSYPVSGYDLCIFDDEVETAEAVDLPNVEAAGPNAPVRRYAALSRGRIVQLTSGEVVVISHPSARDGKGGKAHTDCVVIWGMHTGDTISIPDPEIEEATLVPV